MTGYLNGKLTKRIVVVSCALLEVFQLMSSRSHHEKSGVATQGLRLDHAAVLPIAINELVCYLVSKTKLGKNG